MSFDEPVLRIAAVGFAVALGVSLVAVPLCLRLARRFGIVDKPGGRKTHEKITPLLGGVGVVLGQIVGVLVLMLPTLRDLISGGGSPEQWLYQLFFLGWYLTIVNSFNFSDNMNGLMSGLSVVAFAAAIMYLSNAASFRSMTVAVVLLAAVLGFMPYNFPRSRVLLGDTGSIFIGSGWRGCSSIWCRDSWR